MKIYLKLIFACLWMGAALAGCQGSGEPDERESHEKHEAEEGHAGEESEHAEEVRLTPEQIKNSGLKTSLVEKRPLSVEIDVLGEIASDTDRVVQLRPSSPGTVREVMTAVGDTAQAGEVLVKYVAEGAAAEEALKASQPGVVVGLYAEKGGHVDPAVPLVTLADASNLRCGLDVYEKDIGRVRKGQSVRIKVAAYPNDSFSGRITYISPRVDENSRTIKVRADITNPGGKLKFGMFVRGFIQVGSRSVLAVPEEAVQKIDGTPTVFIVEEGEDGTFAPRAVTLGESSGGLVEIKSGLEPGRRVATHGSFILKSELSKGEMGEGHGH